MLNLVSAHILHWILETNLYLYSYNDCILQDFKATLNVCIEDLKPVQELLCENILKQTWTERVHREFIVARNLKLVAFRLI
jgi:hypothetical protein